MAYRLYINQNLIEGQNLELCDAEFHYLKNVLRMEVSDEVLLFNEGGEFAAKIESISKKSLLLKITDRKRGALKPSASGAHIMFSLIKGEKVEFIATKCTELGALGLGPLISERTNVKNFNEARFAANMKEASEQCGRQDIPKLYPMNKLENFVAGFDFNLADLYFLDERRTATSVGKLAFSSNKPSYFIIGPEGGFSAQEFEFMQRHGAKAISIPGNILRAETAAMAICAIYSSQT